MDGGKVSILSKVNEVTAKTIVTQEFVNKSNHPNELNLHYYNYNKIQLFSSFNVKIGDSMKVTSKVIKENKAEEKYTDAISSGNVAILTTFDENDKNKIITHIGNIPPKQKVIFESEFIESIDVINNCHEFQFFNFNNIPVTYTDNNYKIKYDIIECEVEIKTQIKINKVEKKDICDKLIIKEENFEEEKHLYKIRYEYQRNYDNYDWFDDFDKIFCHKNKICFKLDLNYKIFLFSQLSKKHKNEQNFFFSYRIDEGNNEDNEIEENLKLNPSLFILLINKSFLELQTVDSVEAFHLFFHSIPAGSYYQLITDFSPKDDIPKEYNPENISESFSTIKNFQNNKYKTGTNLFEQFKYIEDCKKHYNKISLPKKIFLFTNEDINNETEILDVIENLSKDFSIHSFGTQSNENFIKKAGIIGKGNYNTIYGTNNYMDNMIIKELNDSSISYIYNFNINSELDKNMLYEMKDLDDIMFPNLNHNFFYLTKEIISNDKYFDFIIKYNKNRKDFICHYKIEPIKLPPGDELSKMIMYEFIVFHNKNLSEDERIKLAIKYQIFIEGTSLFAEVESSKKIDSEMILYTNNQTYNIKDIIENPVQKSEMNNELNKNQQSCDIYNSNNTNKDIQLNNDLVHPNDKKIDKGNKQESLYDSLGDNVKPNKQYNEPQYNKQTNSDRFSNTFKYNDEPNVLFNESNYLNVNQNEEQNEQEKIIDPFGDDLYTQLKLKGLDDFINLSEGVKESQNEQEKNRDPFKESQNEQEKNRDPFAETWNGREKMLKLVYSQNILEGFWDINSKTQYVKDKYKNEFELLKRINIDDITSMTILVIYHLRNDFFLEQDVGYIMVFKKANLFIKNKTGYTYESIIKKAGIKYNNYLS